MLQKRLGMVLLCCLLLCPVWTGAESDDSFFGAMGLEQEEATAAPVAQPTEAPEQREAQIAEATASEQGTSGNALQPVTEVMEPEGAEQPAASDGEWHYYIPLETLLGDMEYIRLVNTQNLLDESYAPKDLEAVKVRKSKDVEMLMRKEANEALTTMFEDAAIQGITLYAASAYRKYYTQAVMYENRLEEKGVDDGYVQKPGASDHQTGLGIDVIDKGTIGKTFSRTMESTDEARWMAAHCWEYGYIIRYPKSKEEITNIAFEPWHLRYVGSVEVAGYIMNNDMTLEEFTEEWQAAVAAYDASLLDGI